MTYPKRRTKQELCDAVYGVVKAAEKPVTRLEIAREIGMAKSPQVINMIEGLVSTGWLKKEQMLDKWGRPAWFYSLAIRVSSTVEACAELVG